MGTVKQINIWFFDSMELHSTDENKELLKKYNDVFNGIRNKIKKISGNEYDYEKDYMKIKFNSDDDLLLNKQLKFHNMIITIRPVFDEDGKLYPQVFLDDTLYELNLNLIKQIFQKNVIFAIIGILKISVLNINLIMI